MIHNVDACRKKSLYKKWGEPTEYGETSNEDRWIHWDEFQLVVAYNDNTRIENAEVIPST